MIIPYQELSYEALQGLIEDFVTREGTDYGWQELSREQKAAQLMASLQRGELKISYDPETQTCGLVAGDAAEIPWED